MHVALSVLPAGIALTTLRSTAMKIFTATAAVLIAVSTLTASEHHVLDVVAGVLLGWAGWRYWRAGRVAIPQHDGLAVEIGISR
jgi:membrane-associated phospholipid phosphatase